MTTTRDTTIDLVGWRNRRSGRVARTTEAAAEFDDLYRAEYGPLMRVAYGLTGSPAAAEDIVQEAFLRAHQRWDRIGGYDRPGAWLRRVVINLATSRSRRARREVRAIARLGARERTTDPGDGLERASHDFWVAVRGLPVRQQQAVVLYYGDDLSVSAVADVMACAEGTVRALLHQARTTLSTILEDLR